MISKNIIEIQNTSSEEPVDEIQLYGADQDPHTQMLAKVAELSRSNPQKNLSSVTINPVTRSKKVAMIMSPFWSPHIAPYNIARLTALAKSAGFESCAYDLNILCYHKAKDLWSPYLDWKWDQDVYWTEVHPLIEDILLEEIDRIVAFKPDIAGFSLYYTNNNCASWIIRTLKERLPNIKILGGGSQAVQGQVRYEELFDHIVSGEGEIIFLELLENIESNATPLDKMLYHPKSQRIDLDSMPWPDYSDLPLELYELGTAVGSEISRGCVAKCQFCSETTFWRYRGRLATNIVDEIEYHYRTFNVRTIWFIDSLVNGNLKELRAFALGVVAKGMDQLNWVGYCRCDHRMDLAYLQDLRKSGCQYLNFGIESGSQKVLNLMKKNVSVTAIEQNMRDITTVGIGAITTWFVGFPGEDLQDLAHTMTLMWRTRQTNIAVYSVQSCYVLHDTPLGQQPEKFGISLDHLGGQWMTEDHKNTILHRLIRLKSINVIMNHMRRGTDRHAIERPGVEEHYTLCYNKDKNETVIPYETDFNYNIIQPNINPVADSLVNELWPLFRTLWLAYGAYEITINFDHDTDMLEWGHSRMPVDNGRTKLNAKIKFQISDSGEYFSSHYYDVKANITSYNNDDVNCDFLLDWQGQGNWSLA